MNQFDQSDISRRRDPAVNQSREDRIPGISANRKEKEEKGLENIRQLTSTDCLDASSRLHSG